MRPGARRTSDEAAGPLSRAERRAADLAAAEDARLAAYFKKLEELIPEPPRGWREAAKPPGSTPRTSGRPGLLEADKGDGPAPA